MLTRLTDWLDRLIAVMDTGSLWLARFGGLLILLTVGMVTLEVISRGIWGRSLGASTELSGYVLAISASWSFAHALFRKAHIRIDLVYLRLPLTARAILDLVALASLGLFCVFVAGAVLGVASHSYAQGSLANTPLQTPLWIPQWLWAGGMLWFSAAVTVLLLRVLLALLARQPEQVQRLAGSPTLDDQIESETAEDMP
ncbi:TRAP-type mannitol/chloroaromatic compound transport system, small permease component [Modicisalibacter ilicicola DSM 19980]|uniref:TRAP transporter small permease protein n=1 Tax=Modicisalibacter ilicicola DSM 19980 TaxID=1121942 RepID=A0A1M5CGU6_9GAMM|nr:TRAP transporter small permease [Halomonas ilicicola]SHF53612.1 TRAP-type mannitol/chloroaromatic compound transport system, small permease component [Halomonas ilicicola DSM 19980]